VPVGIPPLFRNLVREHFAQLSENPEQAVGALFPTRVPVCDATLLDSVSVQSLTEREQRFGGQVTQDGYALRLIDARIITRPKPHWMDCSLSRGRWQHQRGNLRELAAALTRARQLAGTEKDKIFSRRMLMAFEVPADALELGYAEIDQCRPIVRKI
jgi:hypothetical protein